MIFDATLLNFKHYKVRIKGKVKKSREWSRAPQPLHLSVVAIEKRAFGSPWIKVANFYLTYFESNNEYASNSLFYKTWIHRLKILLVGCFVGFWACHTVLMYKIIEIFRIPDESMRYAQHTHWI